MYLPVIFPSIKCTCTTIITWMVLHYNTCISFRITPGVNGQYYTCSYIKKTEPYNMFTNYL